MKRYPGGVRASRARRRPIRVTQRQVERPTAQGGRPSWASWRSRRPGAAPSEVEADPQRPETGEHRGETRRAFRHEPPAGAALDMQRRRPGRTVEHRVPDARPVPVDEDGAIALQRDVVAANVEVKERLPLDRRRAGRLRAGSATPRPATRASTAQHDRNGPGPARRAPSPRRAPRDRCPPTALRAEARSQRSSPALRGRRRSIPPARAGASAPR